MSVTENIDRIEQGKTSIISSIKSKGVIVPNDVLINEIAPYIEDIEGGGVPTDTDTYNRLNFTNISGMDGILTIEDKVDISNMEYSTDSYTFSKVEERMFAFPKNATIYLKWEGDCNLDKNSQSAFFTTNINTIVSGILRNGDIDREYNGLFNGVESIKDVSNLIFRSEYLGEQSIASAFRQTGITQTPTIEATKFGVACFDACYMDCIYLQKATKFKVEECQSDSFLYMYRECPNLHNVEIETNQWNTECFREWLYGCASEGYLYSNFENIPTNTESGLPMGWKRKKEIVIIEDELVEHNKDTSDWDYLVFNNNSDFYDDIKINNVDTYVDKFEYSTDGGETFYYTNRKLAPLYPDGETIIRWEGKLNKPYVHDSCNYNAVFHVETAIYSISGELKHGNEKYNYTCMFKNEWWLCSAENLRLTSDIVGESGYELLFYNCGNLQIPPQITATTVYHRGCCEMFSHCQALQYAPELTATNLYTNAYFSMFANCKSLITAPTLPATNLDYDSYLRIFQNCNRLNYVKCYIEEWNTAYTIDWLDGVASEGTLETNATNIPIGSSGIPEGWTVKPIEPSLPLLKSKIYIGTDGSSNDDIQITIPKEVGSFYGSVGNDYENSTYYPNEEGTVLTTNSSQGYSLFNISKTDTSNNHISFNRKVQVEIDLFEDIDDYAFNRLFYQSNNVSKVVLTSYNVKIGKSAFEYTFYKVGNFSEVIFDLKNSELSEGTFKDTFSVNDKINNVDLGKIKINENCKSTFNNFMTHINITNFNGEFILPQDENGYYYVPEDCFNHALSSDFNTENIFKTTPPNIIKKNGMNSMFRGNHLITETPFIPNLIRVEEQGMSYCFFNPQSLEKIRIDFSKLQYIGANAFESMFDANNGLTNSNLHFEVYDGDISNILMNIGNTNTVFSEFSCFNMFRNSYINAPNLLYVDYNNPIPEGCFENMFYGSENLQTIGIGNMTFNYSIRHPFNYTFRSSMRLNKINSKLTDYTSFGTSNWLQDITTEGVLKVPEDANLGYYSSWLPDSWTIEQ